jgi:hypothetical protein
MYTIAFDAHNIFASLQTKLYEQVERRLTPCQTEAEAIN